MKEKLEPLYLPALKGRVGSWAFYTTLMKFSEIEERIQMSDEVYQNKNLSDMVHGPFELREHKRSQNTS